jgi:hypothetical protein
MEKVFPRWWNLHEKTEDLDHIPVLDRNVLSFQKQASLFDVFRKAGYAKREKRVGWSLVGHGHAYADCGQIKAKGCDNVGRHKNGLVFGRFYKRSCRRKSCPTCFEAWASHQAERALVRMASFVCGSGKVQRVIEGVKRLFAKESARDVHANIVLALEKMVGQSVRAKRLRPIHVVLSPSKGFVFDDFSFVRKLVYRIARRSGVFGGACIIHPYRLRCRICHATIPDYTKACLKCGDSRFEWFWSPHFHVVGFGWVHGTKAGYERHGWVVKNLGVRKSVYATFQYLLSHAGVGAYHTTTWFGRLAYNVLRHVAVLGVVRELCPLCMAPLRPLKCVRELDRPPPILVESEFYASIADWRCY